MSWSTNFWTMVSINRETINSKEQLERMIEEKTKLKNHLLNSIRALVFMTEPQKFMSNDYEGNAEWYLNERCDELFEFLEEVNYDLYRLELLENCWDECHDKETGLAIDPPENIDYNTSYCNGDFVKTVKYPTGSDIDNY